MLLVNLALMASLSAAAVTSRITQHRRFGCGVDNPTEQQIQVASELAAAETLDKVNGIVKRDTIDVDLYVHIVSATNTTTNATISKQVNVLIKDFLPSGFSFKLKDVDRTVNDKWAVNKDELQMKTKLRQGGRNSLNLYFLDEFIDPKDLGICTLPDELKKKHGLTLDGCMMKISTMPGGEAPFDLGRTATHEVGHWFGLFHTFYSKGYDSGCEGAGDYIDDTPASSSSSSGCPVGRDSCPNLPGLDPITNYMDYSDDSCYTEFTQGQNTRMHSMWDRYRK